MAFPGFGAHWGQQAAHAGVDVNRGKSQQWETGKSNYKAANESNGE